jgi:Holliday junction resolvase
MTHPSKQAGIRFEREMVNLLKKYLPSERYTIVRSADSRSPVDVVVIKHVMAKGVARREKEVFGIQCKSKKDKKPNAKAKEESV